MPTTIATEDTAAVDDLSTLSWVHDELRRSLEAAHKALRRFHKEAEALDGSDVSAVDTGVLRAARAQIHQGVGALEMIGLPGPARVLRTSEAAVQRFVAKPRLLDAAAIEAIESASFGVLDYLGRKLAGKGLPTLALFPQYLKLQPFAGADRVHPADLWRDDFEWRSLPADPAVEPRAVDAGVRREMEALMLAFVRAPDRAVTGRLGDLCAALGRASEGRRATLWQLAAAFFEAQAAGRLDTDVFAKRVASRLLAQLRLALGGQVEVSERLAQDLLFFCAHARSPDDGHPAPRLAAVRAAYACDGSAAFDYHAVRLGRFDPALIAQARKRVAAAKELWSAACGGEPARATGLAEQFTLVGDSLRRLYPSGEVLADALQQAVGRTLGADPPPGAALAMEVATAVLYLDASLEEGEFDHPQVAGRVQRLAQRVREVGEGRESQPLEPWMEELYRRVSDRQTMGSVVHELRAALSEVEKQIDRYFRDPAQADALIPVPGQLGAMRGVLSVLDLDAATQAVLCMRDDVEQLARGGFDAHPEAVDRLADNLGALSFMIDMLSVQPQTARELFAFDAGAGRLAARMGRRAASVTAFGGLDDARPAPLAQQARSLAASDLSDEALKQDLQRLSQQALLAEQTALAEKVVSAKAALERAADDAARRAVRAELAQAVAELAEPAPEPVPVQQPVRITPEAGDGTGLEDDAEMRDIFVEEAREVVAGAHEALRRLAATPDDLGDLTVVRRAFHTLKGSSRMIGLADFGDTAWACEQLYNARLAEQPRLDAGLRALTVDALDAFSAWVDAIAAGRAPDLDFRALAARADALRLARPDADPAAPQGGIAQPGAAPPAFAPPEPHDPSAALLERVPNLPSAADLRLDFGAPVDAAVPEAAVAPAPAEDLALDFRLDFGSPAAESGTEPAGAAVDAAADAVAPEPADDLRLDFGAADVSPGSLSPGAAFADAPFADAPLADAPLSDAPLSDAPLEAACALPEMEALTAELGDAEFDAAFGPATPATAGPGTPAAEAAVFVEAIEAGQAAAVEAVEVEATGLGPGTPAPADAAEGFGALADDEPVKVIGDLRVGLPLFNIFLNEADELSRRLCTAMSEWLADPGRGADDDTVALAHSLAGSSATVGHAELSALARSLEHALARSVAAGGAAPDEVRLFSDVAEEIRHLLHQFAAGFLKPVSPALRRRVDEHEAGVAAAAAVEPWTEPGRGDAGGATDAAGEGAGADATADLPSPAAAPPVAAAEVEEVDAVEEVAPPFGPVDAAIAAARGGGFEPAADGPDPRLAEPAVAPDLAAAAAAASLSAETLGQPTLTAFEPAPAGDGVVVRASADAPDGDDDIDATDTIDDELFPIFRDEAEELLPQLQARMREWTRRPAETASAAACMRTLHTFKGGARLAGAMRLGEMAHRLETAVEHLLAGGSPTAADVEALLGRVDAIVAAFEQLGAAPPDPAPSAGAAVASSAPSAGTASAACAPVASGERPAPQAAAGGDEAPAPAPPKPATTAAAHGPIDWSRFSVGESAPLPAPDKPAAVSAAAVRVRAPLLDRLVNQAGEVSITRARIESDVGQIKGSLADLTENLDRLRRQLRDLELQAESQIASRIEAAKAAAQEFDPLEMDRFTRFQELTRMMAESVNDVATVQRGLQRSLQATEDELASQARLTRDLQEDLLRTRMVEFESLADRLYRVVRQAAKETGKQVRLDIVGGSIEVDRGVLDRMTGPFEHLLRNSVAHGIEPVGARQAAGKDPTGTITIRLAQEGNEVAVEFRDDGAGLNLARIRDRAVAQGLLDPDAAPPEGELANLIFAPGFSTADSVSELAGRGVGMDVVRAEVNAMGGRIETATAAGQGASFRLVLPLTTAVTQVVMLRCGALAVAVPSTLVEEVKRVPVEDVEPAYAGGVFAAGDRALPFFWLGALLQAGARGDLQARTQTVLVIRSAAQRIALHVDEVLGNQEVVVKNLGPQLSRLPGLAGVTLLPSGAVALIYNPVALAATYGEAAREQSQRAAPGPLAPAAQAEAEPKPPLVLVVDDSLTVRRVTQRLLTREGYRVALAKDGLDALEKLATERPAVVLSDIEMPRMDGFDLVRNMRSDERLAALPVIMITSRIAQKHRDYAAELGVDHYLGKPYSEEELLALVARHVQATAAA